MLHLTQLDVRGYVNVAIGVTVYIYICCIKGCSFEFFILQANANGKGAYVFKDIIRNVSRF